MRELNILKIYQEIDVCDANDMEKMLWSQGLKNYNSYTEEQIEYLASYLEETNEYLSDVELNDFFHYETDDILEDADLLKNNDYENEDEEEDDE